MRDTPNRLLDDVARLFTDAAGMAQGLRREVETLVRVQMERLIRDMDVVSREEHDALRDMVLLARAENDRLNAKIAALEAEIAAISGQKAPKKPATAKKTSPKS
jgi:BMFP domain-containing protein YqiC